MIPLRILGSNAIIKGDGIPSLNVRYNNNIFTSSWEPTPEELDLLNRGGRVLLSCYAVQPIVCLNVIETNLEYADYITPYTFKTEEGPDWDLKEPQVQKKKRGRPRKTTTS